MVQQASQVFYVKDLTSEHWYGFLHRKKQGETIDDDLSNIEMVTPIHSNHNEGIYI